MRKHFALIGFIILALGVVFGFRVADDARDKTDTTAEESCAAAQRQYDTLERVINIAMTPEPVDAATRELFPQLTDEYIEQSQKEAIAVRDRTLKQLGQRPECE